MNATVAKYLRTRAVSGAWPLETAGSGGIRRVVVVPAFAEESSLDLTLTSLAANPSAMIEATLVIVVVNNREPGLASPDHIAENQRVLHRLRDRLDVSGLRLGVVDASSAGRELGKKDGVGMARKIGMDHAISLLSGRKDGLIISLDADTQVQPNYLAVVMSYFGENSCPAAVIEYEHDLTGPTAEAIARYEIFLRYHVMGLRLAGSPYAFHTIGSAMACTAGAYAAVSGMPRRQAGEDFYFLQSLAKEGPMGYITDTTVVPSSRASWRVPFGTGRSVSRQIDSAEPLSTLYNPASYSVVGAWLRSLDPTLDAPAMLKRAADIHPELARFLGKANFAEFWTGLKKRAGRRAQVHAEFHRWFDGFRTLKLIHHFRDSGLPDTEMFEAVRELTGFDGRTPREVLCELRRRLREEES